MEFGRAPHFRTLGAFNAEMRELYAEQKARREFQDFLRQSFTPHSNVDAMLRQPLKSAAERAVEFEAREHEYPPRGDYEGVSFFALTGTRPRRLEDVSRDVAASPAGGGDTLLNGTPRVSIGRLEVGRMSDPKSAVQTRDNATAQGLKLLRKVPTADGRRFNPTPGEKSVFGTPARAGWIFSARSVRRRKRREVLFARGFVGRR